VSIWEERTIDKILIIGGSGLLGGKIAASARQAFEVHATYNTRTIDPPCHVHQLDKCDRSSLMRLVSKIHPQLIVDTAALHNVDYCERNPDEAWKVNVQGTINVAEASKSAHARFFFISTDFVFDGCSETPYVENDSPNPIQQYGRTKLEAERAIMKLCTDATILRTAVLYGEGPKARFLNWVLSSLRQGKKVPAYSDQTNCPTLVDDLARAIFTLHSTDKTGLYHAVGRSCVNRYEFARAIARIFHFPEDLVIPVLSESAPQLAKRPKNCCLSTERLERDIKLQFMTVEEGLRHLSSGV